MTAGQTPVVLCRECGQPMRVDWQPGLVDVGGYYLCTCDNSRCLMGGYTLGVRDYATLDLEPYLRTSRKKREVIYGEIR